LKTKPVELAATAQIVASARALNSIELQIDLHSVPIKSEQEPHRSRNAADRRRRSEASTIRSINLTRHVCWVPGRLACTAFRSWRRFPAFS